MFLGRIKYKNKIYFGIVEGDYLISNRKKIKLKKVKVLTPTIPTKIICLGLNYKSHAIELNMKIPSTPVIFLKPPSSIIAHKEKIIYPKMSKLLHYEGEVAVVVKKTCKDVKSIEAKKYILGITAFNDVTARDLQRLDGQWTRAKSFDTFAPFGPFVNTNFDPYDIKIKTYLNDVTVQNGNSSDMIFDIYYIVSFISRIMTLHPGDIISTGTPCGVGELKPCDKICVEVNGIMLENSVIKYK